MFTFERLIWLKSPNNEYGEKKPYILADVQPEFRVFRGADRLCPSKCQHQPDLCYPGCRSAPAQLLLDPPAADGNDCPAAHRKMVRPYLVQDGPPQALSAGRRHRGRAGDDFPAQCGQPQFQPAPLPRPQRGDVVRPLLPHLPRHLHQRGHAAVQDDGGRHGQ